MGKLWMPVSNFKKIHEDDRSATLQHPDGHQVVLAKNILSPAMKEQLAGLQIHGQSQPQAKSKGGKIRGYDSGGSIPISTNIQDAMKNSPGLQANGGTGPSPGDMPYGTSGALGGGTQPTQPTAQNAPLPMGGGGGGGGQASDPMSSGMPGVFGGKSAYQLENQGLQGQLAAGRTMMGAQQAGAGMKIQAANQGMMKMQQDVDRMQNGFTAPDGRQVWGIQQRQAEADAALKDAAAQKINPQSFMEQGALPKVITALGLIGSMSNSKGAGEQLLNWVNQQQDRDMKAQIENRNTKFSALDGNIKLMGNMMDGFKMTQAQNMSMYQMMFDKAAATTDNGMAKAQYQNLSAMMAQKKADFIRQWTIQDVLSNGNSSQDMNNTGSSAGSAGNSPTDSMGNPLSSQGVNLGRAAPMFNQYSPVTMPGTGKSMFPKNAEAGKDANEAVKNFTDLDAALKDVHESTNGFNPIGIIPGTAEHAKRAASVDRLRSVVSNLAQSKKLNPVQLQGIQNMLEHVTTNPIMGGAQQENLQGMARQNNDNLQSTLKQDIGDSYHRPFPGPDGKSNGG